VPPSSGANGGRRASTLDDLVSGFANLSTDATKFSGMIRRMSKLSDTISDTILEWEGEEENGKGLNISVHSPPKFEAPQWGNFTMA
jgi:hypothetical protein